MDSEFGSASKYADLFNFDTLDISSNRHPAKYVSAIKDAEQEGYDVVIIDSISHAWEATLDVVEKKKTSGINGFSAWSEGSKVWDFLQNAIQASTIHVIATMRSKTEYSQEKDEKGKTIIRKLGMAPEVRNGTEYAYDVVLDMSHEHVGVVSKTRCHFLDGYCAQKPNADLGKALCKWLSDGIDKPSEPPKQEITFEQKREMLITLAKKNHFSDEAISSVLGDDWAISTEEQCKKLNEEVKAAIAIRNAGGK